MTTAPEAAIQFAQGPTGPVGYRIVGPDDGRTVVLLHGANMAAGVWDQVLELMPGYRLVTLDLRGHGLSTPRGPFAPADYLADIEAVLGVVGADSVDLVGVSIGGLLGCALARRHPERVRSVVAFGSSFVGQHRGIEDSMKRLREMGVAGYFAWSLPRGSLPPDVSPQVERKAVELASEGRSDVDMVEQIIRSIFDQDLAYLVPGPVGCPVLVITGEFDMTCTPQGGQALAAIAGGRWELLLGAGHVIPLERPEACAKVLIGFYCELAGIDSASGDQVRPGVDP